MRNTRNTILAIILTLTLMACAGWTSLTYNQKIDASLVYYQTFAAGLSITINTVAALSPSLAAMAAVANAAIDVVNVGVEKLAMLHTAAPQTEIATQVQTVDGAVKVANAVVGKLQEASK